MVGLQSECLTQDVGGLVAVEVVCHEHEYGTYALAACGECITYGGVEPFGGSREFNCWQGCVDGLDELVDGEECSHCYIGECGIKKRVYR